jgi:ferredoxin
MKLVVDTKLCQGHGLCHQEAPSLIDLDEGGYASIIGDGEVHAATLEAAENAIALCPTQALRLQ